MIFVMAPVMLQNIGNIMLPVACSIFSDITCTNTNSFINVLLIHALEHYHGKSALVELIKQDILAFDRFH